MNRRLIILSVPNIRIARVLLNEYVLSAMKNNSDIVVATPFAEDNAFRREYSSADIDFLQINPLECPTQPARMLYTLSELMRMLAYYRKYRRAGLQYYWAIISKQFGDDGKDSRDTLARRLVKQLASIAGLWRSAWLLLDKLVGPLIFRSQAIENLTEQYQHITLVQASSWGDQDRMLAWYARRLRFRSVLLPYTTDQLWVNGYLLCNYDAVCVQGLFEERCARNYHNVADSSIVRLGSMWFRAVDLIMCKHPELLNSKRDQKERVVLYAGVGRAYFPRASEFQAIDSLIAANQNHLLGDTKLVYRPYAMEQAERAEIISRYGNSKLIQLQWPEEICAGLNTYSGGEISVQLLSYIKSLVDADILIMSHTTSLGLDAAYLGCGVIANFADDTGLLARRKTHLRFMKNGDIDFSPGMPITRSIPELIAVTQKLLNDSDSIEKSRKSLVSEWDFQPKDSLAQLRAAIYGKEDSSL